MIAFNKEIEFEFRNELLLEKWICNLIELEGFRLGEINFIFVSDDYLLEINSKHLKHNTLTDVISFDYSMGKLISGDVYISIERILENSATYNTTFENELHRVMAHGVLHYCGYKDKMAGDRLVMREKEDFYLDFINF